MAEDTVAVDVGGTFTDICVLRRETGELRVAKVPSTADPIEGVMAGVREGRESTSARWRCSRTARPSRPTR